MKDSFSYFGNVVIEQPEFQLLEEGWNTVRLLRHEELDSFTQYSGEPKPETKEYEIPTPQLAITVVSAEKGKSGGLTHRFNGQGYVRWDELTEDQKKDERYSEVDGFACAMHKWNEKTGEYELDLDEGDTLGRIVDVKRTNSCKNILMQFCMAAKLQAEKGLFEELNRIEADPDATFDVLVTIEDYDGKDQYRLSKFRKAEALIEADTLSDE